MKNKIIRTFTVTLAAVLCLTAFSTTAFAGGTDPNPEPLPETTEAPQEEEPTTGGMEPEGVPVTPEGNATLVDDFYGDKQLITVTTKAGNYFYILIDRANEDKETAVHFLNQVDDADLQALLEDGKAAPETCTCTTKCAAGAVNTNCPVCKTNMTECTGPEPEPQEPAELPNLSHFQYRSYHPKPGGGFSEIHDLREYRPGDSLHEIHWKLSAKSDKLIVREAEEPDLGLIVLSFDFSGTRTQLDSTLRQLLWLSGWLIDRGVPHQIDWIEPDSLEPQTKSVKTLDDLKSLLNTLLQTHLTGNTPSLASRAYPHADWRYHVQSETQEVQQA